MYVCIKFWLRLYVRWQALVGMSYRAQCCEHVLGMYCGASPPQCPDECLLAVRGERAACKPPLMQAHSLSLSVPQPFCTLPLLPLRREPRATDLSIETCKKRYGIFKEHYTPSLRLKV